MVWMVSQGRQVTIDPRAALVTLPLVYLGETERTAMAHNDWSTDVSDFCEHGYLLWTACPQCEQQEQARAAIVMAIIADEQAEQQATERAIANSARVVAAYRPHVWNVTFRQDWAHNAVEMMVDALANGAPKFEMARRAEMAAIAAGSDIVLPVHFMRGYREIPYYRRAPRTYRHYGKLRVGTEHNVQYRSRSRRAYLINRQAVAGI